MKRSGILLLLVLLLVCGCSEKAGNAPAAPAAPTEAAVTAEPTAAAVELTAAAVPAQTPVPEQAPAVETPAPAAPERLAFTEDEGPEAGIRLTLWTYDGLDAAEFYTLLVPTPEEFPFSIGTMYEGPDAALLSGVVRGDRESGTAELLLIKDGGAETVLTLMYARDRVALLELDAGMLSYIRQDPATGLYLVVFTDDGPLSFADAAAVWEGLLQTHALAPVYTDYGIGPDAVADLSTPQND